MPTDPPGLVNSRPAGILDVLDRVLDKGLVVVGDIRVSLINIELLTLQIRLVVCSIDKAREIGIDWWRFDPMLNSSLEDADEEPRALEGPSGEAQSQPNGARRRRRAKAGA